MNYLLVNILKSVIILMLVGGYYVFLNVYISPSILLWMNLGVVPMLAGAIICFLMKGNSHDYIFPMIFPPVALIVGAFYVGVDHAVPGLQYWVVGVMLFLYLIGMLLGFGIKKIIRYGM